MSLRVDMQREREPFAAVHAADQLLSAIDSKGGAPVCVGIDPVLERLPPAMQCGVWTREAAARAIGGFSREAIHAVAAHVPCVKIQAACFERYGSAGWSELEQTLAAAHQASLIVILDAKRGDIGLSAEHYAAGAFNAGDATADWLTINPYLGEDGIVPFLEPGRGAFALVRTSNPGGDAIQSTPLADGGTVAEHVAKMIALLGAKHVGESGYSALGAVVGATKAADAVRLRAIMPQQVFLVPGYGAQGGTAADVLSCFRDDGRGAIITASRSVLYAFAESEPNWARSVSQAAEKFAGEIRSAVEGRFG